MSACKFVQNPSFYPMVRRFEFNNTESEYMHVYPMVRSFLNMIEFTQWCDVFSKHLEIARFTQWCEIFGLKHPHVKNCPFYPMVRSFFHKSKMSACKIVENASFYPMVRRFEFNDKKLVHVHFYPMVRSFLKMIDFTQWCDVFSTHPESVLKIVQILTLRKLFGTFAVQPGRIGSNSNRGRINE